MKHSSKKQSDKSLVSAELDELLTRLHVASKRLNAAAQDAGRRIQALDERLADAEPGIAVWGTTLLREPTTFRSSDREAVAAERVLTLGYTKVKKDKWGIAVREVIRSSSGAILSEESSLVSKAERAVRLLALPHLESLTRQIVEAVEGQARALPEEQGEGAEPNAEPSQLGSESVQN